MLLVEAKYCREELRELLFQPLTGKQVAHGTQSCHHGKPELKGQQKPPRLLPALSPTSTVASASMRQLRQEVRRWPAGQFQGKEWVTTGTYNQQASRPSFRTGWLWLDIGALHLLSIDHGQGIWAPFSP